MNARRRMLSFVERHNVCRRRRLRIRLAPVIFLALLTRMFSAFAWTSSNGWILYEDVHGQAITQVLHGTLTDSELAELIKQQGVIDKEQDTNLSYEHSMTGMDRPNGNESAQRKDYIESAEGYVRKNLADAQKARSAGNSTKAMDYLARVIHALEDATSPAHEGFQTWSYNESIPAKTTHVWQERYYPRDARKDQLEGSVRYAYGLYLGKIAVPQHFFSSDGRLVLPKEYGG